MITDMKSIVFQVPGKVQGKARPRLGAGGHTYTPAITRLYERKIQREFKAAGGTNLIGPLHVDIEIVYGVQKSASKRDRMRKLNGDELAIMKPDIDNVEKIVYDALNRVAYEDDAAIVSSRTIKGRYEEEPRLIVRVREMETHEIKEIHDWLWEGGDEPL